MSSITAWLTGVSNKATYYQHLCYMPSVPWPVYKTPIFPLPPSLCYELLLFQFVLLTLLFYSAILSCHLSQLVAMNFNSSCAPLSFLCLQGFLTYIWTYKRKSTNKRWAFFFFFLDLNWNALSQINQFNVCLFLFHLCATASALPGQTHTALITCAHIKPVHFKLQGNYILGSPHWNFKAGKGS